MAYLCLAYRQEIAIDTQDLWYRALSDLADEAFLYACERAVRECEHFPLPATLRRLCADLEPAREPTPYHLRALPSPDELAMYKARLQAVAAARTGDPEKMSHWQKRVAAARERWRSRREAR
jgi:hypothetical protein